MISKGELLPNGAGYCCADCGITVWADPRRLDEEQIIERLCTSCYQRRPKGARAAALRGHQLCQPLKRVLAGHGPDAQAVALAEMVAIWLAGHDPLIREEALRNWLSCMSDLVNICEREMFGEEGHPGRRERPLGTPQ